MAMKAMNAVLEGGTQTYGGSSYPGTNKMLWESRNKVLRGNEGSPTTQVRWISAARRVNGLNGIYQQAVFAPPLTPYAAHVRQWRLYAGLTSTDRINGSIIYQTVESVVGAGQVWGTTGFPSSVRVEGGTLVAKYDDPTQPRFIWNNSNPVTNAAGFHTYYQAGEVYDGVGGGTCSNQYYIDGNLITEQVEIAHGQPIDLTPKISDLQVKLSQAAWDEAYWAGTYKSLWWNDYPGPLTYGYPNGYPYVAPDGAAGIDGAFMVPGSRGAVIIQPPGTLPRTPDGTGLLKTPSGISGWSMATGGILHAYRAQVRVLSSGPLYYWVLQLRDGSAFAMNSGDFLYSMAIVDQGVAHPAGGEIRIDVQYPGAMGIDGGPNNGAVHSVYNAMFVGSDPQSFFTFNGAHGFGDYFIP